MKRDLEIVCLIVWVIFLCIVFVKNVRADEPEDKQPTKDGAMLMCVFTGGSWENGVCTKPAKPRPAPASENQTCNPLVCMITYHGKCVNGVCVIPSNTPVAKPVH